MSDKKSKFEKIEHQYLLFRSGESLLFMGSDFLGVNGRGVDDCSLYQGPQERSVKVDGEEVRIRVFSEIVRGPITVNLELHLIRNKKAAPAPPSTFKKIREITARYRNWPLMFFKPREILVCRKEPDRMRFLLFDRVHLRILNKPTREGCGYWDPCPRVVWNHLYQDGADRVKLVYLDYPKMKWEHIFVVGDRQYIDHKVTPGNPRYVSLLRPSRFNAAAELWVYRKGKRVHSFTITSYVRRRSGNYTFSGYKSQENP